ncbi:MAG TPA: SDR family oxidoreductase [Acidimicrobiia bacterium]|nr:SDR family oxidoreductase [Acidimicrobiia bacterium]
MLLEGKVAAITGASRGMGAAFAERFASEGAAVSLAARDVGLLEKLAANLEEKGARALVTQCDVTDIDAVDRFATSTLDQFGQVDVLVNNAGALAFASFLDETDEQWNQMLDVNLNSARWVTRAFLPSMIDHGGGKVIFMSSNAAKKGFVNDAGYSVAKAGLMALTKVLAVEYGTKGIETFCVHPGLVADTDMGESVVADHIQRPEFGGNRQKFWDWANPLSPTGFHPSVQEIVDLVTFLASPGSTVLHGTCITADHGFTPY